MIYSAYRGDSPYQSEMEALLRSLHDEDFSSFQYRLFQSVVDVGRAFHLTGVLIRDERDESVLSAWRDLQEAVKRDVDFLDFRYLKDAVAEMETCRDKAAYEDLLERATEWAFTTAKHVRPLIPWRRIVFRPREEPPEEKEKKQEEDLYWEGRAARHAWEAGRREASVMSRPPRRLPRP